jgi:hypothetical protein
MDLGVDKLCLLLEFGIIHPLALLGCPLARKPQLPLK